MQKILYFSKNLKFIIPIIMVILKYKVLLRISPTRFNGCFLLLSKSISMEYILFFETRLIIWVFLFIISTYHTWTIRKYGSKKLTQWAELLFLFFFKKGPHLFWIKTSTAFYIFFVFHGGSFESSSISCGGS